MTNTWRDNCMSSNIARKEEFIKNQRMKIHHLRDASTFFFAFLPPLPSKRDEKIAISFNCEVQTMSMENMKIEESSYTSVTLLTKNNSLIIERMLKI